MAGDLYDKAWIPYPTYTATTNLVFPTQQYNIAQNMRTCELQLSI